MEDKLFNDDSASDELFIVWRCIIAMAHADGVINDKEFKFIRRYINNFRFSTEQKEILQNDFILAPEVSSLLNLITDISHKRRLIQMAERVALSDGFLSNEETALLKEYIATLRHSLLEHRP